MRKEKLKTIILTLLIFSSVILSVQIWILNPVWSERIGPKTFIENLFTAQEGLNINDTGAFDSLFSPRSFVFTYNDGRLFFNTTEQEGEEIRSLFNSSILSALSQKESTEINETEWQTMLKSNSIYADYGVAVSAKALSEFLGGRAEDTGVYSFDQAVIAFDQIGDASVICFRNSAENKQIKISLPKNQEIREVYSRNSASEKESYSYAFEINLDKKVTESQVQQSVIMDSYVLIPIEPVTMNTIRSKNIEFTEEGTEKVLELFGYNPKIARKFVESNGNVLYIDTSSTLKFYPENGTIEYTASKDGGIRIKGDGNLSSIASGCGKLLDDIGKTFEIDPNVTLFINSPLIENSENAYTITFDYLFNGNSIEQDSHSCEIVVENGKIKSFVGVLVNYEFVAETEKANALDALEALYTTQGQDVLVIDELRTGYVKKEGSMEMQWIATVDGKITVVGNDLRVAPTL